MILGFLLNENLKGGVSANSNNLYTRLLSGILPEWREYPKRNESFICSSSIEVALNYNASVEYGAGVYWVLP